MLRQCYYNDEMVPYYFMNKHGDVYSYKNGSLRKIKPYITHAGYAVVKLSMGNGKFKGCSVHRLVACTFIPNVGGYYDEVDHIDTNRLNNDIANLCWTSRSGNHRNPITRQRYSDSKRGSKNPMYGKGMINIPLDIHYKKVMCIETGEVFESITQASKKYNLEAGNIGRVCSGKRKTCGGYHWRYL